MKTNKTKVSIFLKFYVVIKYVILVILVNGVEKKVSAQNVDGHNDKNEDKDTWREVKRKNKEKSKKENKEKEKRFEREELDFQFDEELDMPTGRQNMFTTEW